MTEDIRKVLADCVGDDLADALIEHRKKTVKKPLTVYAAKLLVKEYEKTGSPQEAAEMQILHGWQGFRSDWFTNARAKLPHAGTDRPPPFGSYTISPVARQAESREEYIRRERERSERSFR
jgi:hypothetical protein